MKLKVTLKPKLKTDILGHNIFVFKFAKYNQQLADMS